MHFFSYLLRAIFKNIVVKFNLVAVVSVIDFDLKDYDVLILANLSRGLLLLADLVNCEARLWRLSFVLAFCLNLFFLLFQVLFILFFHIALQALF